MALSPIFSVTLNNQNLHACIDENVKTMVQFSAAINLWLRVARTAMIDCNLKKFAKFFKFPLSILEKIAKN